MMSVSDAHSRYERLPLNDLRPFIRNAMLFESPMTFFNTLLWCGVRWYPTLSMAEARRLIDKNRRTANIRDLQQQQ